MKISIMGVFIFKKVTNNSEFFFIFDFIYSFYFKQTLKENIVTKVFNVFICIYNIKM